MFSYARWIDGWERRLAGRDTNRLVRPFEWGLEWLGLEDSVDCPRDAVGAYSDRNVAHSEAFFSYQRPRDYKLQGSRLTFSSPLATPYPENNLVHAQYFPSARSNGRAVLVLPQWNADAGGHIGLCRLLNRFGVASLRLSLAYHDHRMPAETGRADYHVSSNIGRTIHACRQSVIDARACLDWLADQGYTRLGILGTSLGSCIAFITAAHDRRIRAAVFNHVSTYFGDVVWTGLSTAHVRAGLEGKVTQDELRRYWAVISPASYIGRLAGAKGAKLRSLLVWARYDTTFLPVYSRQLIDAFRDRRLPAEVATLPCAHYTTGQFPFNLLDGLTMCRFILKNL